MPPFRRFLWVLALASSVSLPSFAAQPVHPSRSKLQPCKMPGDGGRQLDALCGLYDVWENREARAGRKISLKVVVLPALAADPLPDPVFQFSGGPGGAATKALGYFAKSPLRQERDFVFVDQRGTGEPDSLACVLAERPDDLQSHLGEMFPLEGVLRCRDRLARKYDLTQYSTAAAVDDFDEVRAWLGYGKINLVGGSYGTRTAQTYLRRHPESVRTVTLWGVVPMDEPIAFSHAAYGQRALDLVLGWCEADAVCRGKFPAPRADFQAVMDRLDQGPVEVEVPHPKTGEPARVRLSRDVVADGIRLLLYSAESAAALPVLLRQAAAGDWQPLGREVVKVKADLDQLLADGLFFSVTCAEDIPFIDPAAVPGHTAGSFLGDYRVRRQTAACALWPRARLDPGQREAVRSDLPVLLVNGEADPVTPPDFGQRAARFLTRSLHLAEPYASHEESSPCVEGIANEFVRRGTAEGLDTSCVREVKPRPFLIEVPKESIAPFD